MSHIDSALAAYRRIWVGWCGRCKWRCEDGHCIQHSKPVKAVDKGCERFEEHAR